MGLAHGGQMLLSAATTELLRGQLPEGVTLRDVGEHRLKGLLNLEHLWQVVAPDLSADFPPLASLNTIPNNLPAQLTSFVGREKEITEVKRLLAAWSDSHIVASSDPQPMLRPTDQVTTRLLTLTGSGGAGKTRLSLQVAAEVLDVFKDGVWFVELAPLSDPALVPQTVASVLGLREEPSRPLLDTVCDYLRAKTMLLILDNCEHLVAACAQLVDALLRAASHIKILASSREALGITGELAWRVPSLALPPIQPPISNLRSLTQYEAVRLFIERAVFVSPSFTVTNANAPAVAQICHRLDGIPLALELAAARVKALSVEQIAARLDNRFRLLTGGSRTAVPRQQTLRALMDWSYDLLPEPERVLLRRSSVFVGGWALEAAETICAGDGIASDEVLDFLSHLVDKSLVIQNEISGAARYHLLETIRQ
jgi:predicted ATPase